MFPSQDSQSDAPLYARLRELLARFPEGPLPDDALDAIRAGSDLGPEVIDLDDDTELDFDFDDDLDQDEDAARATDSNAAVIGAIMAAIDRNSELQSLSAELRRLHTEQDRYDREDPDLTALAMPPERARTLAVHLLGTGTTRLEILLGFELLAVEPRDEDAEQVRVLALLSSSLIACAVTLLERIGDPAPHLYWVIERSALQDREDLLFALLDIDFDILAALPGAAPVGASADLVLEFAAFESVPRGIYSDRRFAEPFLVAAENAHQMIGDPASLNLLIRLWDSLSYGRAALLAYGPGEREQAASLFRSALATPEASATARGARPEDPDSLWRIRQTLRAARSEPEAFTPGLSVRVTVPPPSSGEDVRANLLVDGLPLAERHLAGGDPETPETVLHFGGGLQAAAEPHAAQIGKPSCGGHGCCESLIVDISDEAATGRIRWAARFTDTADPAVYHFDPAQYGVEIARAAADFDWEWPARRTARLLRERLEVDPDLLARWECELHWIGSQPGDASRLRLAVCHPRVPSDDGSDEDWLQFILDVEVPDTLVVDDDVVRSVVEQVVADLRLKDPRSAETWSGGVRDMAQRLGDA